MKNDSLFLLALPDLLQFRIDTIQKALDSAHENLLNAAKREEDLRVALEKRIQDIKRCKAEVGKLNFLLCSFSFFIFCFFLSHVFRRFLNAFEPALYVSFLIWMSCLFHA